MFQLCKIKKCLACPALLIYSSLWSNSSFIKDVHLKICFWGVVQRTLLYIYIYFPPNYICICLFLLIIMFCAIWQTSSLCIVLYHIVWHCIVLYGILLYCMALYCIVMVFYCIVLYGIVLCCGNFAYIVFCTYWKYEY